MVTNHDSLCSQWRAAAKDDLESVQLAAPGNLYCHMSINVNVSLTPCAKGVAAQPLQMGTPCTCASDCLLHSNARKRTLAIGAFAVVTAIACSSPRVSTAMWRLIPKTFLPASWPLNPAVSVFLDAVRSCDQKRAASVAPLSFAGRANLIF